VCALLVAACAEDQPEPGSKHAVSPVRFRASDGVLLDGRLFGDGRVGIVLSHMGRGGDSQRDWYPLARSLARQGYLVLTYNRRGVCPRGGAGCSKGVDDLPNSWKDVAGAYRFLRRKGAEAVALVGASIGAMSSLEAAARRDLRVAAVVEIAGINDASGYSFTRADLRRLEGAKLFVSASRDPYGAAAAARTWYRWARPPKRLAIVPSDLHGTDLLRPGEETRRALMVLVRSFLQRALA
jgi:pimeloyl-ACP methyl ester carboxylesterase